MSRLTAYQPSEEPTQKCPAPASQLRGRCFEFDQFYYETESFQIVQHTFSEFYYETEVEKLEGKQDEIISDVNELLNLMIIEKIESNK